MVALRRYLTPGLIGLFLGLAAALALVLSQAPPCAFAAAECPVGSTSVFSNNLGIQGNTTFTLTLTATPTAARTVTIQDSTDTLVGRATTDTLTNKTLSAPTFTGAYTLGGTPTFGMTMAGASTFSGAITLSATTGNILVVGTNILVANATDNLVGVGTVPSQLLHLRGGTVTSGSLRSTLRIDDTTAPAANVGPGIRFIGQYSGGNIDYGGIGAYKTSATASNTGTYLSFHNVTNPTTSPTEKVRIDSLGNVGIATIDQFGGGTGVVGLANASTVPASNPTGGGVLYAEAGDIKWRATGGVLTKLGATTGFFSATGAGQAAAITNIPAGGTGTAAGGWDTAANRDTAITSMNAILTALRNLGFVAP